MAECDRSTSPKEEINGFTVISPLLTEWARGVIKQLIIMKTYAASSDLRKTSERLRRT